MVNADQPKNGNKSVLLALAGSPDKIVQLGTLAAVVMGGFSSFFQGQQISSQVHDDRDKAVREIHALYNRVDDFETRQLKVLANQREILELLERQNPHVPPIPEKTPE